MDNTSAPLADYFWIAGIDSISYSDLISSKYFNNCTISAAQTVTAINEDKESSCSSSPIKSFSGASHTLGNSRNRLSTRSSILTELEDPNLYSSNRSSITIKPPNAPVVASSTSNEKTTELGELNFDQALLAFASQRENFLDDLNLSAGAEIKSLKHTTDAPYKSSENPRLSENEIPKNLSAIHRKSMVENTRAPENDMQKNMPSIQRKSTLKTVKGSIKSRLNFRDMNSVKKQPTVLQRNASVATSKRMSGYNSVIPPPEPLDTDPNMHPLKRRFEPVLLDRYPPKTATDEIQRRGKFPDYVPMFAFPDDIQIVSSDERPHSTWHGFAMTTDDSSRIYGITVIVWTPMNVEAAENLERQCEEWRQSHMTNEERELAASLAERLASERANLSQLLAQLPTVTSGSTARETLEEQISAVEEKIGLMTDMLRPVRHGAAAKIDGLTDGETGLWIPRAFGILGRDGSLTSFWKEWLRAVIVPMTDGAVLRVPASSPRVGRWQPLERYVVNLCTEALSPVSSKTQVEIAVRELRLFARKEAANELPGSRNTDLYALFRCLSIPNIVTLFEYVLSESRIIMLSSYTAMLHLACSAIVSLLYPLKWASIYIPVLPARLISALEAPCPYIVGIERRYENIQLPEDDYVLVDLDQNIIESCKQPMSLPRQQRRKLLTLIQLAALHHNRCGVPTGPPPYVIETFPFNAFSSENEAVFTQNPPPNSFAKYVSQNSTNFGGFEGSTKKTLVFNAFLQSKNDHSRVERPSTGKSNQTTPPTSLSPASTIFTPPPSTPLSRNDSGFTLTTTLRNKRSGQLELNSRRSSSFALERNLAKKGARHGHKNEFSFSNSLSGIDTTSIYGCTPISYPASTLAASTIMPNMLMQPVQNTDCTVWVEGHCFEMDQDDYISVCSLCDEKADGDGIYHCNKCGTISHSRCLGNVSLVCPWAFFPDRIRAAFVRLFASLFFSYEKFMEKQTQPTKGAEGLYFRFDMEGFIRSLTGDHQSYISMLRQTQGFNQFIYEREITPSSCPSVQLFDSIIQAKKSRSRRTRPFQLRSKPSLFLANQQDHLWRSASVPMPTANFPGHYQTVVSRIPAQLDINLMREPRVVQGMPRTDMVGKGKKVGRKAVPSMISQPTSQFI